MNLNLLLNLSGLRGTIFNDRQRRTRDSIGVESRAKTAVRMLCGNDVDFDVEKIRVPFHC
jgi:hypothetical protein